MAQSDVNKIITGELAQFDWQSVLEVGCATGAVLSVVKGNFPDKIVKGIDCEADWEDERYKGVLKHAKNNGLDVEFGDGRKLNFDDESFDVVFCQAVLVMNKKEDFKKVIYEMIRVAKKVVIMVERHSDNRSKDGEYYDNNYPTRLIANFRFLEDEGYNITLKKIPTGVWAGDWANDGYIIKINKK